MKSKKSKQNIAKKPKTNPSHPASQEKEITTLKLEKETKNRLEKLREHKRETYDEIIRKILFVLNKVRIEPEKAQGILEIINEKRNRMLQEESENKKEETNTK